MDKQSVSKVHLKFGYGDIITIQVTGNTEPYELPNTGWSRSKINLPTISYPDGVNYPVFTLWKMVEGMESFGNLQPVDLRRGL